ncbi:hypothetical protein GW17_00023845 [Ensete ventricosum]|nr:hypothetical protein GW17_00023845 [Ensete ventricosum]
MRNGAKLFSSSRRSKHASTYLEPLLETINNPRFFLSTINPEPPVITTEAFLSLTHQVQALVGMMQAIVPNISQLKLSVMPQQLAPLPTPQQIQPQSPSTREEQPNLEGRRHPIIEIRSGTPSVTVARLVSHPRDSIHATPELDTLSFDSTNLLREQLRQVNQRLDEVQKEFVKSEELGESSKGLHLSPRYRTSPF